MDENYILAKSRVESVFSENYKILNTFSAKELINVEYEPIYDYFKIQPVTDSSNYILIIIPQSEEILYQFKNCLGLYIPLFIAISFMFIFIKCDITLMALFTFVLILLGFLIIDFLLVIY